MREELYSSLIIFPLTFYIHKYYIYVYRKEIKHMKVITPDFMKKFYNKLVTLFAKKQHTHDCLVTPINHHKETASGTTPCPPSEGMLYPNGLYMTLSYQDPAAPALYGNIINTIGNGSNQIFCEWSNTDNLTGNYIIEAIEICRLVVGDHGKEF